MTQKQPYRSPRSTQISLRLPNEWIKRVARLSKNLSAPGFTVTPTDVFRMALSEGLLVLEQTDWSAQMGEKK